MDNIVWVNAIRFCAERTEIEEFKNCVGENFEAPEESNAWCIQPKAVLHNGNTFPRCLNLNLSTVIHAENEDILEEKITKWSEGIDWSEQVHSDVPKGLQQGEELLPFEAESFVWEYSIAE